MPSQQLDQPSDQRLDRRTVTPRRLAANQAAAQRSTGPTSPEGKQRAAEARELWDACAKDHAKPGDPRARRIRALIEEERAALAEEQELFGRRQALNMDEPGDGNGVRALGKTWLAAVGAIERLDRQINAKVRLLIRLRAVEANPSGDAAGCSGGLWPPAVADKDRRPEAAATETTIAGTKPSKPLESTKPADEAGETGAELAEPNGPADPVED